MVCDRWERGTGLRDWASTCHTCMWCDLGKSVWYWSCDIFSFLFDWSAHLDSGPFCWKPHLNRSSGSKVIWTIGRVLKTIENTKEIHSFYCLYLTINAPYFRLILLHHNTYAWDSNHKWIPSCLLQDHTSRSGISAARSLDVLDGGYIILSQLQTSWKSSL